MSPSPRVHSFPVLQWNAGGLSQSKRTEFLMILHEKEIDVFSIMEANLTSENLKNYLFKEYSLYVLPNFKQVASGIKKELTARCQERINSRFSHYKSNGN
ncbi:hypothetical protein NPIL_30121 [Nephila pilipes]|uniref:Endonuclease/exonuclease/phosphatase domain-containing protein n=1 Tax=Nephila pilipes TaxID=299642 RepID=A0A8X6TK58_NEPPI|nr:hypothetical protein NPIL_30121 [Nephila pilipes]